MKLTYTGIEVRDMDESVKFYSKVMKMKLLDRHRIPETGGEVASAPAGVNTK